MFYKYLFKNFKGFYNRQKNFAFQSKGYLVFFQVKQRKY